MLTRLLPDEEKDYLLALAKLLAYADKPLRWEGKTQDEITSDTDTSDLSIELGDLEKEIIADLKKSLNIVEVIRNPADPFAHFFMNSDKPSLSVVENLIDELKTYPITTVERTENRERAAIKVLREISEEKSFDNPTVPKIILFELLLIALRDGVFSDVEQALLKEFQRLYEIDDFIFEELLDQAQSLNEEISKTIALVLE